ncbi:MAG: hypothetical protein RLZZ450_2852 [Pseudomonadota bacterium]
MPLTWSAGASYFVIGVRVQSNVSGMGSPVCTTSKSVGLSMVKSLALSRPFHFFVVKRSL